MDDIHKFLADAPNTSEWIIVKAATIIALHSCLRNAEAVKLQFEDVIIQDGLIRVKVSRCKAIGPQEQQEYYIVDALAIGYVKLYVECFEMKVRCVMCI